MNRILTLALVALTATPLATGPVAARVMESGDAAVAQKAMPAVVNISTWKVKQPEKEGEVTASGEDLWLRLHHRSERDHRHQ